jgi:hypothetical protein
MQCATQQLVAVSDNALAAVAVIAAAAVPARGPRSTVYSCAYTVHAIQANGQTLATAVTVLMTATLCSYTML